MTKQPRRRRSVGGSQPARSKPEIEFVVQIRVELLGVEPPIWRRIEAPSGYSFWDLHVAIQDAMGWQDSHLHSFRLIGSKLVVGIPDDEEDPPLKTRPGWKVRVLDHLTPMSPLSLYEYDFGDSWLHEIRLEDVRPADQGALYPRCSAGARRCPPEDCGGTHGYQQLLSVISDPDDPEHDSMLEWLGADSIPRNSTLARCDSTIHPSVG